MKHVRRLGIALITFLVGVAVSPIQFYVQGWGHGKVIDGGGNYAITAYTSSYLVKLWYSHASYFSADKADQVFNQELSRAVQVFELGPKLNREGVIVGHRAVALFFSPETSSYYTIILWTDGRILHYIYSTSALHAKEFEKHQR